MFKTIEENTFISNFVVLYLQDEFAKYARVERKVNKVKTEISNISKYLLM